MVVMRLWVFVELVCFACWGFIYVFRLIVICLVIELLGTLAGCVCLCPWLG